MNTDDSTHRQATQLERAIVRAVQHHFAEIDQAIIASKDPVEVAQLAKRRARLKRMCRMLVGRAPM